jgi:hypothetical protein
MANPNPSSANADRERESWARNEAIRRDELRRDARRSKSELLEEAVRLSRVATELASGHQRTR